MTCITKGSHLKIQLNHTFDMNESDLRSDVHYLGSSENDLHIFLTV